MSVVSWPSLHDAVGELHEPWRRSSGRAPRCARRAAAAWGCLQRCHQQRERLALAAGEQSRPWWSGGTQGRGRGPPSSSRYCSFSSFVTPQRKTAALAAAGGEGEVLFDPHRVGAVPIIGSWNTRPMNAARLCSGRLVTFGAVDDDLAGVDKERAGGGVEHRGLARAVAADDGDEVAVVQRQTQAVQRGLGVDGAGVEGLIKFLEFKHGRCLRSLRSGAAPCGGTSCSSSRGWRGRPPRSAP